MKKSTALISWRILFFLLLAIAFTSHAAAPIKVTVKKLGNDIVFVFQRSKAQIIALKYNNNQVTARSSLPAEYQIQNPAEFDQYAKNLLIADNKQQLTFQLLRNLQYHSIINGEKLDAIKFKLSKPANTRAKEVELKTNEGEVTYSVQNGEHILLINVGHDQSKLASFFQGGYLWLVTDQHKIFSFKQKNKAKSIFQKFELIPTNVGTCVRLQIDSAYRSGELIPVKDGWQLSLSKTEPKVAESALQYKFNQQELQLVISGDFDSSPAIRFAVPALGYDFVIVPTKHGIQTTSKQNVEFDIMPSIQGVPIIIKSDNVVVEKSFDQIFVKTATNLAQEANSNPLLADLPPTDPANLPSLLPYLDKGLDILDFNEQRAHLYSEIAKVEDPAAIFAANLNLAKFFFKHGLYHESLDTLKTAKAQAPSEYEKSLLARFLTAVNYTMILEYLGAKEEYNQLLAYPELKLIPELQLWYKYNQYSLGAAPEAFDIAPHLNGFLKTYPDEQYWPLIFTTMEIALLNNDLKLAEKLFRETRIPTAGHYANSFKFYKADYYRKKQQLNLSKQYYLDLSYEHDDLYNKVRAEFELTKLRLDSQEIDPLEGINILEKLRYEWRVDKLEYQILMYLAELYRQNHDMLSALRTYKYIQTAYSNRISNFYLTSQMAKIFNDIFLPNGLGEKMDDFTLVALFYEFKELNPIGQQGDEIIISIAKRLVKLDLLDNAASLLRHQVRYRLKDEQRVQVADDLANILLLDNKPNEAILILDETDKDNFSFKEHQYRVRLRSRALVDLKQYVKAITYIQDDNSIEADIIRKYALFAAEQWDEYVDIVSDQLPILLENVSEKPEAAQDILRLAIAYYMKGQLAFLDNIIVALQDRHPQLQAIVKLLASNSNSVDYRNLDQTLQIDQMKELLTKYKEQFLAK